MTSCCVYKVMRLTFHDRINTQWIYRFELAQVVARRITKPQRQFFRFESHWLIFFLFIFFLFSAGGGSDFIILFISFFSFLFILLLLFFIFLIPLTCIRHIYKTSVTTQTTVNSDIYANSYSDPPPPPPPAENKNK